MKPTFIALLLVTISSGHAQQLYTFGSPKNGNIIVPSFAAIEANRFTVGSIGQIVTHLGNESDFLSSGPRQVAIWDEVSGAILVSTAVSSTDSLDSGYRYRSINPVTLLAGRTYVLGALHDAGINGRYLHNTSTATLPAGLIDGGTVFRAASTIQPSTFWQNSPPRHYVANLKLVPVPEPASLVTLLFGSFCLIRRSRKQTKIAASRSIN